MPSSIVECNSFALLMVSFDPDYQSWFWAPTRCQAREKDTCASSPSPHLDPSTPCLYPSTCKFYFVSIGITCSAKPCCVPSVLDYIPSSAAWAAPFLSKLRFIGMASKVVIHLLPLNMFWCFRIMYSSRVSSSACGKWKLGSCSKKAWNRN